MNFTPEQIKQAKKASSIEELIELAKDNGINLSTETATIYYNELHKEGELGDDELMNVAGGDKGDPDPRYSEGQYVTLGNGNIVVIQKRFLNNGKWYYIYVYMGQSNTHTVEESILYQLTL